MSKILWGVFILLVTPRHAKSGLAPVIPGSLIKERPAESGHAAPASDERSRALEQKIASVTSHNVDALAEALSVPVIEQNAAAEDEDRPLFESSQLRALGTINNPQDPECVLYLSGHEGGEGEQPAAEDWTLDFLAWDGARWLVSLLDQPLAGESLPANWKSRTQPFGVRIISRASGLQMLALILYDAPAASVYPLVFRVTDHAASLVWDSRSEESRYEPLRGGRLKFHQDLGTGVPGMVVSGKADPGLLVFARGGARGFEERTTYVWKENAYVPSGTEYEANEDLRLYEFISALHLHNYRAAYALIEPAQFLKTDKPSLEAFRGAIQKSWSEFLDDHIFAATEPAEADGNAHAFELDESGKKTRYLPTFSSGPKFLLTSMSREEE